MVTPYPHRSIYLDDCGERFSYQITVFLKDGLHCILTLYSNVYYENLSSIAKDTPLISSARGVVRLRDKDTEYIFPNENISHIEYRVTNRSQPVKRKSLKDQLRSAWLFSYIFKK